MCGETAVQCFFCRPFLSSSPTAAEARGRGPKDLGGGRQGRRTGQPEGQIAREPESRRAGEPESRRKKQDGHEDDQYPTYMDGGIVAGFAVHWVPCS